MQKSLKILCILGILMLFFTACQNKGDQNQTSTEIDKVENLTFSENYRPDWWENLKDSNYIYTYEYIDGTDKASIKNQAISQAQAQLLHHQKNYIVGLSSLILDESKSKNRLKSNQVNANNEIIYKKDYSEFATTIKSEYATKEDGFRCFVAIALPIEKLQLAYVRQYHKNKTYRLSFLESKTYRHLLEMAGIDFKYNQETSTSKNNNKQEIKKIDNKTTQNSKYDKDVVPAWFKVSYNNKKVMINESAQAEVEKAAIQKAYQMCERKKQIIANNYARSEAEKYRKLSEYDEVRFAKFKNQISKQIMKQDFPMSKEFVKTIQLNENSFKTYAQYSIDKQLIQKTLINVLKEDEVLYSRLRASMEFEELENEDF